MILMLIPAAGAQLSTDVEATDPIAPPLDAVPPVLDEKPISIAIDGPVDLPVRAPDLPLPVEVQWSAAAESEPSTEAARPVDSSSPERPEPAAIAGAAGALGATAVAAYLWGPGLWMGMRRLLGSVPFIIGFSRLARDELLNQETRRATMDYIQSHPAASITDIMEGLDIAWGTAVYHLRRLERARLIVSEREGMNRRYWDIDCPAARQRKETQVLRVDAAQKIARLLHDEPGLSQADVRERLGISAGAISQHLRRLQSAGYVAVTPGRRRRYEPTDALEQASPLVLAS